MGQDAIAEIEKNPYILLDITYGIDFNKIDKMAMDLGLPQNDKKRIESAIKYGLVVASNNGHTCVVKENLIKFVTELLDLNVTDVEESIINLRAEEKIIIEERDEAWIYLNIYFKAEKNIAEKLIGLKQANNIKKIKNFETKFKNIEKKANINLSEKQIEAIKDVNQNNVCVITGGPRNWKNNNY